MTPVWMSDSARIGIGCVMVVCESVARGVGKVGMVAMIRAAFLWVSRARAPRTVDERGRNRNKGRHFKRVEG